MNAVCSRLAPVILIHQGFDNIGRTLAEHGSVETTRKTARVLRDSSSYTRGCRRSPVCAGRRTVRRCRRLTDDRQTITLDVGGRTRVQLRRSSGGSFLRGNFPLFCDVVLSALTRATGERCQLLSG